VVREVAAALVDQKLANAFAQSDAVGNGRAFAVHLAVFVEPFLSHILEGRKTIESRFTMVKQPPFGLASAGDLVLLKAAGGPIRAACQIGQVWYFSNPSRDEMQAIRHGFGAALRDDVPGFWDMRSRAKYVSLMELGLVHQLQQPLACPKRDRRGWVILRSRATQGSLFQ
jgi:hypothetical protein